MVKWRYSGGHLVLTGSRVPSVEELAHAFRYIQVQFRLSEDAEGCLMISQQAA